MNNGHIKVRGGTRDGNQPALCGTCRLATTIKGEAESQDRVYCRAIDGRQVTVKVLDCSSYNDKAKPALSDLYEIAWVLETSKNRRAIGFTPWKEYRKTHPDEASAPFGF